jgi:3D (Asp-Asp-Asp) domain-containing protein
MKKRFIIAIVLAALFAPAVDAGEQSVLARVTVYWRAENQSRASWSGARLHDGHCAVDPKHIPFGSKVQFSDATCLAVDTGPAVVSRKAARLAGRNANQRNAIVVDRFFETKSEALAWADSHPHFMTLRIVTRDSSKEVPPELGSMLAQTKIESMNRSELKMPIEAPSGLQSAEATLTALLPLSPLLRAARRRT